MQKCKNIDCSNLVLKEKNIYCSLRCRNSYVNKYLRDYSKNKKTSIDKLQTKIDEYNLNPKKCFSCTKNLPFNLKKNKYCNHSCAAISTNKQKKGIKKIFSEKGLENIRKAAGNLTKRQKISERLKQYYKSKGYETENRKYKYFISEKDYNLEPNKCSICDSKLEYKNYRRKTCSSECRNKLSSKNATTNQNCGGKTNYKKFKYKDIWFDSSWEVEIAKLLDQRNITWERSKKLVLFWLDENNLKRRYHPDFYLPKYDLYLDPKNKYKQILDEYKLSKVRIENLNIKLIVGDKDLIIRYIETL